MKKSIKRLVGLGIVILLGFGVFKAHHYYVLLRPAVILAEGESPYFYVPTGATPQVVCDSLIGRGWLNNRELVLKAMETKNYQGNLVVPGKYKVHGGMSLNTLLNNLRAGNGSLEVVVSFSGARNLGELSKQLTRNLESDSARLHDMLQNPEVIGRLGFDERTILTLFLPDSYRFLWNTNEDSLLARMAREYKQFWTAERKAKASALGLSQSEVTILASIVQAEQQALPDERARIAGLYLNRLKRGMRLQSDPTVIFALQDFSIRRVLNIHLQTDSPYNTYKIAGLPPGPILIPSKQSIDAVLNAEEHNYLYMCAHEDFSGYHRFASTLAQHTVNARKFQQALNNRGVYR